ncbi:MAG: hypothetical protein GIW99_08190 [Candidatus Eremiobacteraeota bacterium]|nr:hypothetical protein [Candidatus Eremiobacteraeota bacterium]
MAVHLTSMRFVASQPVPTARFSEVASLAGGYFAATDNNAVAGKPGIRLFRISAGTRPMLAAGVAAGETPEGIAVDHTGRQFVVSNINSNSIMRFFFDGHGHARLSGVAKTGARPYGIALDEAHGMLFVADNDTSTVSGAASRPGLEKFRLPSLRRVGTAEATGTSNALPLGVAEDSRSQQLFVTNEGDATVTVFSLPSIRRVATLRTGRLPWLPAVDEPDHRLYVPSAGEDVVQQFDTRGYVRAQSAEHVCGYPTAVALVAAAPSSRRTASPPRRSRIARRRG